MRTRLALAALILFAGAECARAELPLIRLDRIFPLGAQAGSEIVLDIAGRDLDEVKTLHFDHPGLKAVLIKPNQFKVQIAADVPPGTREVRAVGKYGISGVRLLAIGLGLTEVRETEPNDGADKAQKVPVNVAINGHSDSNGDDFFRFPAKKGQRLVIDCQGYRLDSTLRAILHLATADGKELLQSRPYYNRTDPLVDFVVPADGDYILRLHDMTFLGGLPYRLIISDHPQVENAFPGAIVPGEKREFTIVGRNLPGGKPAPLANGTGPALDQVTIPLAVPKDPILQQRFAFLNHLPSTSLNARGIQLWPDPFKNALNPVTLALADAPLTLDRENNDTMDRAQEITWPTVICGRFDRPGDVDWYSFTAKAGDVLEVDLLCERLDFPGDPYVIIFDAKGNEQASFDDHGINFNSLAQFNRDPLGTFRAPANGKYLVFVGDRYGQGGARHQYVLRLCRPEPDFYPVAFHETPSDPTCPVVRQGGSAFYELCLNRRNFNGPVTVEAEGLPPGLSCPPVHVSPQSQFANVVFTATANAPEWSGVIHLKARATIDGKKLEREVRCSQRRWAIANINTSVAIREVCLAIRSTAPYAIKLPEKLTIPAGEMRPLPVTVQRHWPDFKGKVQLTGLNLPPGFSFPALNIPADKSLEQGKLTVAGNVPPGIYTVVLRGDAQVPYNRDPKASNRPNVRVADPSTVLVVTVTAAAKKK